MKELSNIWAKLSSSKKYREAFVAAELKRGIPRQIRVLRKQRGWTQPRLAEAAGLTQGVISRAEDPDYGNLTINTLLRIAAGFDIAFVGRFVPFSEQAKWYSELSEERLMVSSFDDDVLPTAGAITTSPGVKQERTGTGVGELSLVWDRERRPMSPGLNSVNQFRKAVKSEISRTGVDSWLEQRSRVM